MPRWTEIFEDNKRTLSSTRVSMLFGTLIGGIVVLMLTLLLFVLVGKDLIDVKEYVISANTANTSQVLSALTNIIGLFFMLCAGVYGVGKFSDNSVDKAKIKTEEEKKE